MPSPPERTEHALHELAAILAGARAQLGILLARTEGLIAAIGEDRPLHEVMAAEERPLIITQLTTLVDQLQLAGGELRRAEAFQLRSEGLTHDQIAAIFGVTRQRAAALLKDSDAPRPTPKRPGAGG